MSEASKSRTCIFCDQPISVSVNRAKEHVVPEWLLGHLKLKDEDLFQGVAKSGNGEIVGSRSFRTGNLLEGRVCGVCNNEWMSQLEDKAKPLMVSLINGERTVHALTNDERLLTSRWAAKTAYVLSYPTPLGKPINTSHLRALAENSSGLPQGVAVFTQQHASTREFSYLQRNTWGHFQEDSGRAT